MNDHASPTGALHPRISVAVCTYNRADRLVFTLDALAEQSVPPEVFEILVIDNRSTDSTAEICKTHQKRLSNLRYIYEPVQGLSKARNTALQQAKADYIAYLDDDAIPCKSWVEAILDAFETTLPKPICVGGPIYPLWDVAKPDWMPQKTFYLFSIVDYQCRSRWLKLPKYPFGANMAFQRSALLQIGGFIECLGREGQSLRSGEEYLVYRLLIEQGKGLLYYEPRASVQHWIPEARMSLNWMLRRSYWQGRSSALTSCLLGKPLIWEWKHIIGGLIRHGRPFIQMWILVKSLPNPQLRVIALIKTTQSIGYLHEVWLRTLSWNTLNHPLNPANVLFNSIQSPAIGTGK